MLGRLEEGEILCDRIQDELQRALLTMGKTPEGQQVLSSLGADRFLPTSDEDYKNLYEMTRELGIDLAQYPLN